MTQQRTFNVKVLEEQEFTYSVEADSPEEARDIILIEDAGDKSTAKSNYSHVELLELQEVNQDGSVTTIMVGDRDDDDQGDDDE
jgi:hypothetical protein